MRFNEDPSGDIMVTDTLPFDFIDVQRAVEVIEEIIGAIVVEWPITIEESNGVWTLCFVNPWPQDDYLDFAELN